MTLARTCPAILALRGLGIGNPPGSIRAVGNIPGSSRQLVGPRYSPLRAPVYEGDLQGDVRKAQRSQPNLAKLLPSIILLYTAPLHCTVELQQPPILVANFPLARPNPGAAPKQNAAFPPLSPACRPQRNSMSSSRTSRTGASKRLIKELEAWRSAADADDETAAGIERLGPLHDSDLLTWEAVINGRGVGSGYDGTQRPT